MSQGPHHKLVIFVSQTPGCIFSQHPGILADSQRTASSLRCSWDPGLSCADPLLMGLGTHSFFTREWQTSLVSGTILWPISCTLALSMGASCAQYCLEGLLKYRWWLTVREAPSVLDKQEKWRQTSQNLGVLWHSWEDSRAEANELQHCL